MIPINILQGIAILFLIVATVFNSMAISQLSKGLRALSKGLLEMSKYR